MRNPNGYGSIYKLSGNRRKPWIVRKTAGWGENDEQLYLTIGYYESRKLAMAALAEYNKNPYTERQFITLDELYKEWSKTKYDKIGHKTKESYEVAWNHLSKLKDMKMRDIRKSHMQNIVDEMNLSRSSCHKVKVLAGLLFKHASADDIISKNYAELLELPGDTAKEKEAFSDIELKAIENLAKTDEWASTILILIYTGLRIGELLTLTKFNVDLPNMCITGGIKSDAGKNRVIPIHTKIQEYVSLWYNKPGSYFISRNGNKVSVNFYRTDLYYPALEHAKVRKLSPHTTRHTFASLMARANVDPIFIQKIIGHADYSTTANIYTHLDIQTLKTAIECI